MKAKAVKNGRRPRANRRDWAVDTVKADPVGQTDMFRVRQSPTPPTMLSKYITVNDLQNNRRFVWSSPVKAGQTSLQEGKCKASRPLCEIPAKFNVFCGDFLSALGLAVADASFYPTPKNPGKSRWLQVNPSGSSHFETFLFWDNQGERDRFISPKQREGGPGCGAGRLEPPFQNKDVPGWLFPAPNPWRLRL
jgi:hypothetical protein